MTHLHKAGNEIHDFINACEGKIKGRKRASTYEIQANIFTDSWREENLQ